RSCPPSGRVTSYWPLSGSPAVTSSKSIFTDNRRLSYTLVHITTQTPVNKVRAGRTTGVRPRFPAASGRLPMRTTRWILVGCCLMLATPVAAQPPEPKPGPEHELLKTKFAGDWNVTVKFGGMEAKATATYKMD